MTAGQPLEKGPSVLSAAGSGSAPDTPSEALLDAPYRRSTRYISQGCFGVPLGATEKAGTRLRARGLPQQLPRFSVSGAQCLRDLCGRGKLEQDRRHVGPQSKIGGD